MDTPQKLEKLLESSNSKDGVIKIMSKFDLEYIFDQDWGSYPKLADIIRGKKLWTLILKDLEEKVGFSLDIYTDIYDKFGEESVKMFLHDLAANMMMLKSAMKFSSFYSKYDDDRMEYIPDIYETIFHKNYERGTIGLILTILSKTNNVSIYPIDLLNLLNQFIGGMGAYIESLEYVDESSEMEWMRNRYDYGLILEYLNIGNYNMGNIDNIKNLAILTHFSKNIIDFIAVKYDNDEDRSQILVDSFGIPLVNIIKALKDRRERKYKRDHGDLVINEREDKEHRFDMVNIFLDDLRYIHKKLSPDVKEILVRYVNDHGLQI